MSNGNDHRNFPPPPNEPPEPGDSAPNSEDSHDAQGSAGADNVNRSTSSRSDDSTAEAAGTSAPSSSASSEDSPTADSPESSPASTSESADATQAMPAPSFDDDSTGTSQDSGDSAALDDQAPPLGGPGEGSQDRPTVAPAASQQQSGAAQQQNEAPTNPAAGPYPGAGSQGGQSQNGQAPYGQNQYGQNQNPQYQNGQYQNAQNANSPYPGAQNASPYPGAQNQAGSNQAGQYQSGPYQTGSGPNPNQTGSGPGQSQAIPQPAPAPGFAGSQTTATRADSRPEKKKSKLPLFITLGAVGLVIILVLVGFLVIGSVNKNNYGPDKVAEDYVAALNKGDFAAAEKIAPSPRPEGTNLDLLSKDFTDSSSAKIERAKVESSKVDGDKGTVTVSYELDGSPYNVELSAKKDGKQDLFFDKWTMTGPALNVISLDVPAADGLTVNGEDYKIKSGTTSFAVYPGNYDFKIPSSKWVSEASDTAGVNFPKAFAPGGQPDEGQVAPTTLNLDISPTDAFQKEVQKQVESKLKKCFDNKSIKPKCKFIKYDPTEIPVGGSDKKLDDLAKDGTAKWDMKDMPKVKASFGTGDTSTGSFFTEKPGKFNFSVDGKKAGSSYFSNGNALSVSGSVKIKGDKLSVEFFDF